MLHVIFHSSISGYISCKQKAVSNKHNKVKGHNSLMAVFFKEDITLVFLHSLLTTSFYPPSMHVSLILVTYYHTTSAV